MEYKYRNDWPQRNTVGMQSSERLIRSFCHSAAVDFEGIVLVSWVSCSVWKFVYSRHGHGLRYAKVDHMITYLRVSKRGGALITEELLTRELLPLLKRVF